MSKPTPYLDKIKEYTERDDIQLNDLIFTAHNVLCDMSDKFWNPISAAFQGFVFPKKFPEVFGYLKDILLAIDEVLAADPEKTTTYGEQIEDNQDLLKGVDEILQGLNAADLGITQGFKCIHDYAKKTDELRQLIKDTWPEVLEVQHDRPSPEGQSGND